MRVRCIKLYWPECQCDKPHAPQLKKIYNVVEEWDIPGHISGYELEEFPPLHTFTHARVWAKAGFEIIEDGDDGDPDDYGKALEKELDEINIIEPELV